MTFNPFLTRSLSFDAENAGQNLLVERFKLAVHMEKKEMQVYELVVGKNGVKMKPSPPPEPQPRRD